MIGGEEGRACQWPAAKVMTDFIHGNALSKLWRLLSSITLVNTMSTLNHVRLCFYTVISGVTESPGQVRSSVEINEGEIDGGTWKWNSITDCLSLFNLCHIRTCCRVVLLPERCQHARCASVCTWFNANSHSLERQFIAKSISVWIVCLSALVQVFTSLIWLNTGE